MKDLVYYHFSPSPPSRGALLTIRNLNLPVEIKEINLFKKEQLNPEFLKINPQHCIPTIDDDGFVLWESRAISQYLVESRAPNSHLYPKEPKKRALVNQRLYFDLGTLYPRIRAICFPVLFLGETTISEEKTKQLYEAFNWLDGFLQSTKWVAGDEVTIADLSILASLASIVNVGADISKYHNLAKWYKMCETLPGFEENQKGAKVFGDAVKSKLTSGF
uniref:Putative glutathione s-transferase n=1 Tax=Tabanus bromius TaxID=304241 RepID=A0A0K8TTV1_TABBR